jgi:hypothetical protein
MVRAGRRFPVEQVRNPLREESGFAHVGAHQAPGARCSSSIACLSKGGA